MKRRDLEKFLKKLGWKKAKSASGRGPHEKWTNGKVTLPVPRHTEINENTARSILRTAAENPPEEG